MDRLMSRMGLAAALSVLAALPAGAQGQPELLFQAEAQVLSGRCTGQPVRLEGNHNVVTLTGVCGSLLLKGYANTVRLGIAPGGSIHVEGSANRVSFAVHGAPPAIVALGPDNDVAAGLPSGAVPTSAPPAPPIVPAPSVAKPPQAAPPPPMAPLSLAGDDEHRLEDCDGRDVTVTGNRSAYTLRGACRSVAVRGDLLTIEAEVAPGARITVTGRGSIVTWSLRGRGHAPAAVIRGEGSRVQQAEADGATRAH